MTVDDAQVINNSRRDMDREIMNKIISSKLEITAVDWFEMLGFSVEPSLKEMKDKKVVSEDNVHLSVEMNKNAAVYLCRRLLVTEMDEFTSGKRRKLF